MHIDLDTYSANRSFIIHWFNTKGGKDIGRTVSTMAAALNVPCIAIAFWLGAETNWHPDSISSIKALIAFYGYTKIKNKPEGSPI